MVMSISPIMAESVHRPPLGILLSRLENPVFHRPGCPGFGVALNYRTPRRRHGEPAGCREPGSQSFGHCRIPTNLDPHYAVRPKESSLRIWSKQATEFIPFFVIGKTAV